MGAFSKQQTEIRCATIAAVNGLCKAKSHIQLGKKHTSGEQNLMPSFPTNKLLFSCTPRYVQGNASDFGQPLWNILRSRLYSQMFSKGISVSKFETRFPTLREYAQMEH